MNIQNLKLNELHPIENNVRVHSKKQIEEYVRSVKKFGQTKPIICDENYTILAGNGLYLALIEAGADTAWCNVISGLSENDKKKLMIADNRVYELGLTDYDSFEQLLHDLDGDFDIPGYDEFTLQAISMSEDEASTVNNDYGVANKKKVADRMQSRSRIVCPYCGESICL